MEIQPHRPVPWWILALVGISAWLVDQITKWIVIENLDYRETWVPVAFLDGIFDFTYTRNTGAAFGMGQGFGEVFLVIAVVVVLIIIFSYRQLPTGSWPVRIAMGLMLGGALGNAIDRVRLGYVVDFLHVHGWPIFNIADSSITVGVVLWLLVAFWEDMREKRDTQNVENTSVQQQHTGQSEVPSE